MKVVSRAGNDRLAMVYIAEVESGGFIEFVESVQPPLSRTEKWVLIISTSLGCRVGCRFCDAGGYYKRTLTEKEIFSQIDYLVKRRFPENVIPVKKFKIQFARMGEPSFNYEVLKVLRRLRVIYDVPGLLPCISTIAPVGSEEFFARLFEIKKEFYPENFQLQFSIHTTDEELRDWLIPFKKWSLSDIGRYGSKFYNKGSRKITLNFALGDTFPVDPEVLLKYFEPDKFLLKITPVNPTFRALRNNLGSSFEKLARRVELLRQSGYETLLSIGEFEENLIGSNCGQYVTRYKNRALCDAYTYELEEINPDSS